jgi:hypothetical protein
MSYIEVVKALPTPGDLHINAALTNVAIAFKQEDKRFVAARVFPQVPVEKQSDNFFIWDRADFFRDEAKEIGPGDEAPAFNLRLSNDTYFAKVFGIKGLVSEQEMANADPAVSPDEAKTRAIITKLMIKREKQWAARFFSNGVWTGSSTGSDLVGAVDFVQWDNFAASDPVSVIRKEVFQMTLLGLDPMQMKLTCGAQAFLKLLDHPKFLERYEQTQAAIMNEQLMAAVLGIGEVVVPYASETTSKEGAAVSTVAFIHGKHALLSYAPKSPAKDEPSAGYMFTWSGLVGAQSEGIRMRRWWDNDMASWKIQGDMSFDPKITSAVCGVFFRNAVS